MGLLEVIIIAVGLSMDAFAVSVTLGLCVGRSGWREMLIPAIYFGFFQALMPLLGYLAGVNFAQCIQGLDHWIAFGLLSLIGGKMVWEGFSHEVQKCETHPFRFLKMLLLAVATSIDALAVGVTFSFFEINIYSAITLIGLTTFFISMGGVKMGALFGTKYKSKAEFLGGAVLILIGIKILIEHLLS
jgi:putative Mn2+ efflux pump MntP